MTDSVKRWVVSCKISGDASCLVEAESYDEAIEKAKEENEWGLNEWECNWSSYNGSIDATEF